MLWGCMLCGGDRPYCDIGIASVAADEDDDESLASGCLAIDTERGAPGRLALCDTCEVEPTEARRRRRVPRCEPEPDDDAGRPARPKLAPRVEGLDRGLEALVRVAEEPLLQERFEARLDRHAHRIGELPRLGLGLHLDHHQNVSRGVRKLSGERLVDERRARVDVGAVIDRLRLADLLGRHERERAEALAHLGERLAAHLLRQLRDAEVEDLHADRPVGAALEEDVRRLEIAVDDAGAVGVGEAQPDLLDDRVELVEADRARALQAIDERLALEQLEHDDDAVLGVLFDVEDLGHVVRVDRPRGARLAAEAGDRGRFRLRVGPQELHRDGPARADVLGVEDLPHAAAAERPVDAVSVRDDRAGLDLEEVAVVSHQAWTPRPATESVARGTQENPRIMAPKSVSRDRAAGEEMSPIRVSRPNESRPRAS